jgi:hypothetical protein
MVAFLIRRAAEDKFVPQLDFLSAFFSADHDRDIA